MKKVKVKIEIYNQRFDIELEKKFYEYIKNDLDILHSSKSIKDLLNLMLSCKLKTYKNENKMTKMLKKLEK